MAVCERCGATIPSGPFTYEGDDGSGLCLRCFRRSGGEAPPARGGILAQLAVLALRVCAVAGLAGGVAASRLAGEGNVLFAAVGVAAGAGLCLGCLALSELLRLALSTEASLRNIARLLDRIEGDGRRGEDADWDLE